MPRGTPPRTETRAITRMQRGLEERLSWWNRLFELPLGWSVIALVGCTWLLAPTVGILLPEWQDGEVATSDVTIPKDIALPDEATTEAVRQEARTAVLPVYDFEPRVQMEESGQLAELFAQCRALRSNEQLTTDALAGVANLVLDQAMLGILVSAECNHGLEQALLDVVNQVYRARIIDDKRALEKRAERGFAVRNLVSGTERTFGLTDLVGTVDLRSELDPAVRARLMEHEAVSRRWIKPLAQLLSDNLEPNLVFSRAETAARVENVAARVIPRSQVFRRGQVLIRRGDTVSPTVARTLRVLNSQRQDLGLYTRTAGIALLTTLMILGWWRIPTRFSGIDSATNRSLVFLLLVLFLGLDRLVLFVATAVSQHSQDSVLASASALHWLLPNAAGPLTVLLLLGPQAAILFAVCMAMMVGILLGGDFAFVVYALVCGLLGVFVAQQIKDRTGLTRVGTLVGLGGVLVLAILEVFTGFPNSFRAVATSAVWAFLAGPLAVAVVTFILPHLERLFGVTTDLRLLELSNQNLPLLKRLSLQAPGTYQHSLAVGNLAEVGADAVGANSLLLRVCAYYHDVGKLVKPEYFVENQRGVNPHDSLSPSMSVLVIKSHVKEGLEMARKEKLPLPIRQAIATHHGTKMIRYFFTKAQALAGVDGGEVREGNFRYPGPKPHTKELGILLLADAVEAAARTIDSPSPSKIQAMISRIFADTLEDGQLDDSALTFSELDKIAQAFMWVLTNMYHHRIDYPGFDFNRRQSKRDSGPIHLAPKTVTAHR